MPHASGDRVGDRVRRVKAVRIAPSNYFTIKDNLGPDNIATTLRHLCRDIHDRHAAMFALINFRLDEIIYELLRIFPGHDGIHKWGQMVLWSISYPKEPWRPSPLSMASPARSWKNRGGSWVIRRQRVISKRRRARGRRRYEGGAPGVKPKLSKVLRRADG